MEQKLGNLGPLPTVDRNNELQRISIHALTNRLPADKFIVRDERVEDFGVDCALELIADGRATNFRSQVQLKSMASAELNQDGSISLSVSSSNLNYLLNGPSPLYVLYVHKESKVLYLWACDEAARISLEVPNWRHQKTVTLRFKDQLSSDIVGQIYQRIYSEGSTHKELFNDHRNERATAIAADAALHVTDDKKSINESFPRTLTAGLSKLAANVERYFDEYLGTRTSIRSFGGRQREFLMLDDWIKNPDSQHALLVEPAGRGKSAFLSRWIQRLDFSGTVNIVFVPVSIRFSTSTLIDTLKLLGERLRHLDANHTIHPSEPDEWVAEIHQSLRKDRDTPLVIVLDGVDEAADWTMGKQFVVPSLGRNVKMVVAARPVGSRDTEGWRQQIGFEEKTLRLFLPKLSASEIKDAMYSAGESVLAANSNIVQQLHRLSEGDPLLVNIYINELLGQGKDTASIQVEMLQGIQPGIHALFETWFSLEDERWRATGSESIKTLVEEFLGICSVALGPITLEDISVLTDTPLRQPTMLRRVLNSAGRFIIGDGYQQGFVFSHPRLRDFWFEKMLAPSDRVKWEQNFLNLGKKTLTALPLPTPGRIAVSEYSIRFYGVHLQRANSATASDIYELLSLQWMDAWEKIDETFGGFLMDVERAWTVAVRESKEDAKHIVYIVRCSLLQGTIASLHSIPHELAIKLVEKQIWSPERAIARSLRMPYGGERACALAGIASVSSIPNKEMLYSESLSILSSLSEFELKNALDKISRYLPYPFLADALVLSALNAEDSEWNRAKSILKMLEQACNERTPDCIKKISTSIEAWSDQSARVMVLCAFGADFIDAEYVLSLSLSIQDVSRRTRALGALVSMASVDSSVKKSACEHLMSMSTNLGEHWPEALQIVATSGLLEFKLDVLGESRTLSSPNARAGVLRALAEQAEDSAETELLTVEGVSLTREFSDPSHRAQELLELLVNCNDPALRRLITDEYGSIKISAIENHWDAGALLDFGAALQPDTYLNEKSEMEHIVKVLLNFAHREPVIEFKIEVLSGVLQLLPYPERAKIIDECLRELQKIQDGREARISSLYVLEHLDHMQLAFLPSIVARIGDIEERITFAANCGMMLEDEEELKARAVALCRGWLTQLSDVRSVVVASCWLSEISCTQDVHTLLATALEQITAYPYALASEEISWIARIGSRSNNWDLAFQALGKFYSKDGESDHSVRYYLILNLIIHAEQWHLSVLETHAIKLDVSRRNHVLAEIAGRYAQLGSREDSHRVMHSLSSCQVVAQSLIAKTLSTDHERTVAETNAKKAIYQLEDGPEKLMSFVAALPFLDAQGALDATALAVSLGGSAWGLIFPYAQFAERLVNLGFLNDALAICSNSISDVHFKMMLARSTGDWLRGGTYAEEALHSMSSTIAWADFCSADYEFNYLRCLPSSTAITILCRLLRTNSIKGRADVLQMLASLASLVRAIVGPPGLVEVMGVVAEVCNARS